MSRSLGRLFIFYRFIELLKCQVPMTYSSASFWAVRALDIFSKLSSSKEKSNGRLADVVYAKSDN